MIGSPACPAELQSFAPEAILCIDQLLFRVALKKAVLKKHKPDSGSETHALTVHYLHMYFAREVKI
jgi:hypothetical protein